MYRTRTIIGCLLTAVFVVGLISGRVAAAPSGEELAFAPPPTMPSVELVDEADMERIVEITERIDPLLYLDADGLVQLPESVTADELGVDQEFLDNYRLALEFSNAMIETGEISVDADLRVTANESFVGNAELPAPGPGAGQMGAGGETDFAQGEVPDWYTWRYSGGAMYYNSYNTYSRYGRSGQYYGLCNSMAAHLGYPWMSQSLNRFYTYNGSYMNRYCYQNSGSYYYLPYYNNNQSRCGGYSPCYGQTSYKPAYFWGQARTYNYGCRCYQYQWQWYGTYCRY